MKNYVLTVILTAVVTSAFAWMVWRIGLKYKIHPEIRERDVHTTPTPRLGGVAMFLGVLVAFALSSQIPFFDIMWDRPQAIYALLLATFLIVVVGVIDDLYDIDWLLKLGTQFLAAGIVVGWGGFQIYSIPIGGQTVVSSWLSFTMAVVAIVVVMNAVNFIDGLDGLVAGVAIIANAVFFAYSYLLVRDLGNQSYASLASFIAVTLIAVCLGFLPLNWTPAKMFMGDSGALMVGLLMAASAIAVTGQLTPRAVVDNDEFGRSQLLGAFIPILLPLVIVLLPILDFFLAVVRRMARGKSPFSPDRKHLHHRMLDIGHSGQGAVLVFYAWTAIVSLSILLMYIGTTSRWPGLYLPAIAYLAVGLIACVVVTFLPKRRKRRRPPRTRPVPLAQRES